MPQSAASREAKRLRDARRREVMTLKGPPVEGPVADLCTWANQHGYSGRQLADMLGVSQATVAGWFKGLHGPTATRAEHIRQLINGAADEVPEPVPTRRDFKPSEEQLRKFEKAARLRVADTGCTLEEARIWARKAYLGGSGNAPVRFSPEWRRACRDHHAGRRDGSNAP